MKLYRLFLLVFFLTLVSISCGLVDPLTKARGLLDRGKFDDGIAILEKEYNSNPDSISVKSLLAQAYSDYGLALCQDSTKTPKEKYLLAKEQFNKALVLNPYLQDAKDMREMVIKIQESLEKNKLN